MRTVLTCSVLFCTLAYGCSKPTSSSSSAPDAGFPSAPSASLPSLNGFEGEVAATVKQSKPGEAPIPFVLSVKSDKIRVDMPERIGSRANPFGGKAYVLVDAPAKKASVVNDAQKQAFVIDLSKSSEQLAGLKGLIGPPSPGNAAPNGPTTKVTKSGTFDRVAGYPCENWDVASDHRETTICVAQQDVPWFKMPPSGISADSAGWMTELLDGKHLPLRLVAYAKDGATEESRIEVTKIDRRSLPTTQFEYPSTYRTIDLAQMFRGLANVPNAMPIRGVPSPGKAQ